MLSDKDINDILLFWFPNDKYNKFWFNKNIDIDNYINQHYTSMLFNIYKNLNIDNNFNKNELLCLIIILDQFSRNISRVNILVTSELIQNMTDLAKKLAYKWIELKYYLNEPINHIIFALMPLRHQNKLHDYKIIINILEDISIHKDNEIYKKFIFHTKKRMELLFPA